MNAAGEMKIFRGDGNLMIFHFLFNPSKHKVITQAYKRKEEKKRPGNHFTFPMIIQSKWWQHGCIVGWAWNAEDEGFWKEIDRRLLSRWMEHTEYGPGQNKCSSWNFYLGKQPSSYGPLEKDVNTSDVDCFGEPFHVERRTCLLNEAWKSSGVQIKALARGTSCGFVRTLIFFSSLYFRVDAQDCKQTSVAEIWGSLTRGRSNGFLINEPLQVHNFIVLVLSVQNSVQCKTQDEDLGIPRTVWESLELLSDFAVLVFSLFGLVCLVWCGSLDWWEHSSRTVPGSESVWARWRSEL